MVKAVYLVFSKAKLTCLFLTSEILKNPNAKVNKSAIPPPIIVERAKSCQSSLFLASACWRFLVSISNCSKITEPRF